MIGGVGQRRTKISIARIPPWRRWVRARELKPSPATLKNINIPAIQNISEMNQISSESSSIRSLIARSDKGSNVTVPSSHVESAGMTELPIILSTYRQFLGTLTSQRGDVVQKLDEMVSKLEGDLANMPIESKIRLVGSFGGLVEYSVHNRLPSRYNTKPLLYQNTNFYSKLIKSLDWSTVYSSTALSRTRTLSPLLAIVRSISRMGLPNETVQSALIPLLSDTTANLPREPKPVHLVELVQICAKHKLVHADLFSHVIDQLSIDFNSFHEDLIGDLVRSFTNLNYYDPDFQSTLERELPVRVHELAWWNLVDLGDYYANNVQSLTEDEARDMIARISNEIWKWIPDMRSGYAAKALRVLSQLDSGDERTRRSLIRAIPKSMGKMHANVAAETIVAAAKVGYSPRAKYGNRHGSVFYRRVVARLLGDFQDKSVRPLEKVSAKLIVQVVESLASIDRPLPELFDAIVHDINLRRAKYTSDQLLTIERLLGDKFGYTEQLTRGSNGSIDSNVSNSSLAYLARTNPSVLPLLFDKNLAVTDMIGLLRFSGSKPVVEFAQSDWLDTNLSLMSSVEFSEFVTSLAVASNGLTESATVVALLAMRANSFSQFDSLTHAIESVASLLIMSNYDFEIFNQSVWSQITNKPVLDLATIRLCQLIAGHMRLANIAVSDAMLKFCQWIETHLVSMNRSDTGSADGGFEKPVSPPPGAVTELSVFPVVIPVALPNPNLDLRKLHSSNTTTKVHRICREMGDMGIAVFADSSRVSVETLMRNSYLIKLGWTVKLVDPDFDFRQGNLFGEPDWRHIDTESPSKAVAQNRIS